MAVVSAVAALAATTPAAANGGAAAGPPPQIDTVTCRSACAGLDRARGGSVVRVTGTGLEGAKQVVFLGGKGRKDDVASPVGAPAAGAIDVQVPARARTGRVRVITLEGQRSRQTPSRLRILRGTTARVPRIQARVDQRRVFIGSARKASVSFFVGGAEPAALVVAVVPAGQTDPIASWSPGIAAPGTVGSTEWDGLAGGAPAPEGLYEFRVIATPEQGAATAAQSGPPSARSRFRPLSHRFPVAGPHTYGEAAARFGAGRSGHSHEGQDVFAACGSPLVAASGGTVKHVAYHSRAGNYVVITADDGYDHAYMHMQQPATLAKGARVNTGDPVGLVGDTGAASGCHLHFEMWSAPGWYTGGAAVDPLPFLKAWDVG